MQIKNLTQIEGTNLENLKMYNLVFRNIAKNY